MDLFRRLLLALFLSLIVLNLYWSLLHPPKPKPGAVLPAEKSATEPESQGGQTPSASADVLESPDTPPPIVLIAEDTEKRIEIETPNVIVSFSNRGARLVSWRLKRYPDGRGRPTELVQIARSGVRPLDVETGKQEIDDKLNESLFRPARDRVWVDGGQVGRLEFEYADAHIRAHKLIEMDGDGYIARVRITVEQAGRPIPTVLLWGPGIGGDGERSGGVGGAIEPQAVFYINGKVERYPIKKLKSEPLERRGWIWAGVESAYFASLFIDPEGRGAGEAISMGVSPEGEKSREEPGFRRLLAAAENAVSLYVGPKDYHILAGYGNNLKKVVPLGDWIGPIVVPLLALLRWVHGHVGNYGWAIVVLTILINLAMAPLRHFGFVNSAKMAKLSPEMRAIQERYRKYSAFDPKRQEMQKEIGALYARHGMSMQTQMVVGCLPLLLTMPFLIAFYRVLQVSIDLRGAAFLWIPDLSQKDPLFITPILMGVSMLAMQSMTPTTVDAAQRRMMMIMPLVLVVMFFMAPAGLNLYWLSSNICAILQQTATYRFLRRGNRPTRKNARHP
ncbi:MAG: membrane protein insertase YidC [Vicinamibacteria bacterium]|nr:membrane protein insertase YidC [Vicinamibacteria bacterium]